MTADIEDLIASLRGFAGAYPEDIFRPLTEDEQKQMGPLLDRASAGMGRHMAIWTTKAADALESLQRESEALKDELQVVRTNLGDDVSALTRENAALRKTASRMVLQAIDVGIAEGVAHSKAEVERLQRELEEARRDAERINFVGSLAMYPAPGSYYIEERFEGGQTFRDAIDAARQKKG